MKKIIVLASFLFIGSGALAQGLICVDSHMFSGHSSEWQVTFDSAAKCQEALQASKNGFVCSNAMMFSAYSSGFQVTFSSAAECLAAVKASR